VYILFMGFMQNSQLCRNVFSSYRTGKIMTVIASWLSAEQRKTLAFLLKWLVIAVIMGSVAAAVIYGISFVLREAMKLACWRLFFLLPLIGAALAGWGCFTIAPDARGDGTSSYIIAVNKRFGYLKPLTTVMKIFATIFTLGSYCSGGMVGPLARINAGIGSLVGEGAMKFGFTTDERRTAVICGMAATVSGLFMCPLGGGIFAVEVLKRSSMRYRDLFPAMLSSCTSYIMVCLFNYRPFYIIEAPVQWLDFRMLPVVLLTIAAAAIVGYLFMNFFDLTGRLFKKTGWKWPLKSLLGGAMVCIIGLIFGKHVMGTGSELFGKIMYDSNRLFTGRSLALMLSILIVGKIIATSATVGSGLSGGLFAPCVLLGTMTGAAMADLLGPVAGADHYFLLTAVGVAAMLSGVLNAPIAGAVIVMELYGTSYAVAAVLASVVTFQLLRARTIYRYAIEHIAGMEKEEIW